MDIRHVTLFNLGLGLGYVLVDTVDTAIPTPEGYLITTAYPIPEKELTFGFLSGLDRIEVEIEVHFRKGVSKTSNDFR